MHLGKYLNIDIDYMQSLWNDQIYQKLHLSMILTVSNIWAIVTLLLTQLLIRN